MTAPAQLREHPLESLLAAGLLLSLLLVAADGAGQNPLQNQAAPTCRSGACVAAMEPRK